MSIMFKYSYRRNLVQCQDVSCKMWLEFSKSEIGMTKFCSFISVNVILQRQVTFRLTFFLIVNRKEEENWYDSLLIIETFMYSCVNTLVFFKPNALWYVLKENPNQRLPINVPIKLSSMKTKTTSEASTIRRYCHT